MIQRIDEFAAAFNEIVEDDTWQNGDDDERRIGLVFAHDMLTHAIQYELPLERQKQRVLQALRAAKLKDETISAV